MNLYNEEEVCCMPKISVIVPVYNSEQYLNCCIDSILSQTFTDFELLLINDGSTDSSSVICNEYAEIDKRVRVFHKPNGGVSSARNMGLDNACGEWITFVDSDDLIGSSYLEDMIVKADADLIVSSFQIIGNDEWFDNSIDESYYSQDEIKFFLDKYVLSTVLCAPWCKLFKNSLISDLRFNIKLSSNEDSVFVLNYINKIRTTRTVKSFKYQYRRGICESLSVKSLQVDEYRYIIEEYSKIFLIIEKKFGYDGTYARISRLWSIYRICINALRMMNLSHVDKYNTLVRLLNDINVLEIIQYCPPQKKGLRQRLFDYLALHKKYLILYIYIILYRGNVY